MKKIILTGAITALLACSGVVTAEEVTTHNAEVKEILSIHSKMTDLDVKLSENPNDVSLNQELKNLETELIAKLRAYNKNRQDINNHRVKALGAMPAAGSSSGN